MPVNKDGIIYCEQKEDEKIGKKSKKKNINIKDICLVITTCISVLSVGIMINQNKMQKLEHERNNRIQIRSSYIECCADGVQNLFYDLKDDGNIRILSNDITDEFYNSKTGHFYSVPEMHERNDELNNQYIYAEPDIYFLSIESTSNRIIRDVSIDFVKISEDNNIYESFEGFNELDEDDSYQDKENINIVIGDMYPNDVVLIPVVIGYYEMGGTTRDIMLTDESIFKKVYVPKSVSCYDDLYEKEENFEIRDILHNSLITKYYYRERG